MNFAGTSGVSNDRIDNDLGHGANEEASGALGSRKNINLDIYNF